MAKKVKKPAKTAKQQAVKVSRWTVRGVPADLQRAAGDAARLNGQTLGQWLTRVLENALMRDGEAQVTRGVTAMDVLEARIAHLEEVMNTAAFPAEAEPSPPTLARPPHRPS